MGGWLEEDENFTVRPSDFTATNFQETENECSEEGLANQKQQSAGMEEKEENHFYKQLGFKVGMIFDGEKKICSGTK